ncbi:uncharacterized protein BDZ83DRAFT_238102 [Colletotrichum acutatum]|uniref:Uncharacterized protein n=1 Tax=Glomerella acutata TaxID=27357 RepID=A0AAD8UR49_GLOAC|nr:uncharacterized protein BDZ83DRAFT_238102 [Colletotrichum acutatum]KAK1726845.1 hypothetical protein BDZ83DRAFT_238102 [Colletotrichum acutatum]
MNENIAINHTTRSSHPTARTTSHLPIYTYTLTHIHPSTHTQYTDPDLRKPPSQKSKPFFLSTLTPPFLHIHTYTPSLEKQAQS